MKQMLDFYQLSANSAPPARARARASEKGFVRAAVLAATVDNPTNAPRVRLELLALVGRGP